MTIFNSNILHVLKPSLSSTFHRSRRFLRIAQNASKFLLKYLFSASDSTETKVSAREDRRRMHVKKNGQDRII